MRAQLALAAAMLTLSAVHAQDAAVTDPDLYKVVFENDRVRVLEYRDQPGDRTRMHDHPAFLVYALSAFERRLTLPDGREMHRAFTPGQVMFSEAQTHAGENVGSTDTHIIMVELK
ncbi:MAG: cytoplasmic protein [Alphaproteobacteria bacterium]